MEQDLQRHDSSQARLSGAIDDAHAAPAELFQELAVADARQRGQFLGRFVWAETRRGRKRCRGVRFDRASQFFGDLGRQPEFAQFLADLGMLTDDRVDVGISTLIELLGHLGQEAGELIVHRRSRGCEGRGFHGHPA